MDCLSCHDACRVKNVEAVSCITIKDLMLKSKENEIMITTHVLDSNARIRSFEVTIASMFKTSNIESLVLDKAKMKNE